jgi:hypothetical protein
LFSLGDFPRTVKPATRRSKREKVDAIERWHALQLTGLSGARAARKIGISHPTLLRWARELHFQLPESPPPRRAATRYGGLHVQMRALQRQVVPLRRHEIQYVQENIEATCKKMPRALRSLWQRALTKAERTDGIHRDSTQVT